MSWSGLTREINALFKDVPSPPIATGTITSLKDKRDVIVNAALQMLIWLGRTPESFISGNEASGKRGERLPVLPADRILRLDTHALFRGVDSVRMERGLTWRKVAEEIGGVTATQLTRLGKGAGIGLVASVRIAQWLERPLASFTLASPR